MIRILVPPILTLVGKFVDKKLDTTIGRPAIIAINNAPTKVILPNTVLIYLIVSFPGLTPGI